MNCQEVKPILGGEFPKYVLPYINAAQNSIEIIIFDWRFYPTDPACSCQQFNNAIVLAAKRAVQVRVVTNCGSVADFLRKAGIKVKKPISNRLLHSKLMIIDGKHLIIGSHNYTQNAFTSNVESSVILESCDDLTSFRQYFNSLFF